jgi:hypothetical protein
MTVNQSRQSRIWDMFVSSFHHPSKFIFAIFANEFPIHISQTIRYIATYLANVLVKFLSVLAYDNWNELVSED